MAGISSAPAKVFVVQMEPLANGISADRDARFRSYTANQQFFGAPARDALDLKQRCREALRAAVTEMVSLGAREARKGNFHSGDALEWSQLDYPRRKQRMEKTLQEALLQRRGSIAEGGRSSYKSIAARSWFASTQFRRPSRSLRRGKWSASPSSTIIAVPDC
jgi:hypothetical protein